MLRKNYGYVRVDFAQPFSLKVSVCRNGAVLEHQPGIRRAGVQSGSSDPLLRDVGPLVHPLL